MNFNLEARIQLAKFCSLVPSTAQGLTKNEIKRVANEALSLFQAYIKTPETSELAQCEFLDSLYTPLKQSSRILFQQKPWWRKVIDFFGFRSYAEKRLLEVMEQIKNARIRLGSSNHYPRPLPQALRDLAVNPRKKVVNAQYNSYESKEKIKYLSHHLMGATPLSHYEILQGKSLPEGFSHFYNDLNNFICHEGNRLDEATQTQLTQVLERLKQGSVLAEQIACIENKLTHSNPQTQKKLISDLSYKIQKAILELPQGKSLLIPHGYLTQGNGHATLLECTKINEHEVIFKLINTGSGQIETPDYKLVPLSSTTFCTPVRATSPLSINNLRNNFFFEELFLSLIPVNGTVSEERMNAPFLKLYKKDQLHNTDQYITLQTNGTCAHSSLLEWFKLNVSYATFQLFHFVTTDKALHHLEHFNEKNKIKCSLHQLNDALTDLHKAGVTTVDQAATFLVMEKKRITQETATLKEQLGALLNKKGKRVTDISNFNNYFKKKLLKNKLNSKEQEYINRMDSTTSWNITTQRDLAFFKTTQLSDRAQKAAIAKKINGHNAFLNASELANVRGGL